VGNMVFGSANALCSRFKQSFMFLRPGLWLYQEISHHHAYDWFLSLQCYKI
jgi:hypothetical protein